MKSLNSFIIIDTGFLVALHTKNDSYHQKALAISEEIKNRQWITTWPVLTETCYYFIQKENIQAVSLLFDFLENKMIELFSLEIKHFSQLRSLLLKYKDLPMDLADASLVILAEELGSGDILSTDQRDFKTYRWKNRHPFHNLL